MKKLAAILAACLLLSLCACSPKTETPDTPPDDGDVQLALLRQTELTSPLELAEGQYADVLDYAGGEALLSVSHSVDAPEGPSDISTRYTDYLLRWRLDGPTERLEPARGGCITSALCDGKTLLYVEQNGDRWALLRSSDGEKQTLRSSDEMDLLRVPELFRVGKAAMLLCQTRQGAAVYLVSGDTIQTRLELPGWTARETSPCSNGTMYMFFGSPTGSDETSLLLCDSSGLRWQIPLDGATSGGAINQNYALVSLRQVKGGGYGYLVVNLTNGSTSTVDSDKPLYRLSGSGSTFLYVDEGYNAYLLYPDARNSAPVTFHQLASYRNWPMLFHSDGASSYLLQVDISEGEHQGTHFWRLDNP